MKIRVYCKKSGKSNKYACAYLVKADGTESFLTTDFSTLKRLLGLGRWQLIDADYLSNYEYDAVIKEIA